MATLNQLGGSQPISSPVSSNITGANARLQPQEYRVGEDLSADLLGAMKVSNANVSKALDVGEDIAIRIANDSNTELALFIEDEKQILAATPNDPRKIREFNTKVKAKQAELSDKTFVFPNIQHAFDKNFTVPTAKSNAILSTRAETRALELDSAQQLSDTHAGMRVILDSDAQITRESFKAAVDGANSLKGVDGHEGTQKDLAGNMVSSFDAKNIDEPSYLLNLAGYDSEAGFDVPTANRVFDVSSYSTFGKLKDGKLDIEFHPEIEKATRDMITQSWDSYVGQMTSDGGKPWNARFKNNLDVVGKTLSDLTTSGASAATIQAQIDILENEAEIARTLKPVTNSDETSMHKKIGAFKNLQTERKYIDESLSINMSVNNGTLVYDTEKASDYQKYMFTGRDITYVDATNGRKILKHISADEHKTQYKNKLSGADEILDQIDVTTKEGEAAYKIGLNQLKELEVVGGGKSGTTSKFSGMLLGNEQIRTLSYDDVKKYLLYEDYAIKTDYSRQKDANTLRTLKRTMSGIDNQYLEKGLKDKSNGIGSVEHKNAISTAAYAFLNTEKKTRRGNYNLPALRAGIKLAIDELASGDLNWSEMSTATVSSTALDAVQQYLVDTGQTDSPYDTINALETFDYGKNLPLTRTDMRGINPKGLDDSTTMNAIDGALKNYNKMNKTDFSESEITLRIENDNSNRHFRVGIYLSNDTSRSLGKVTSANGKALAKVGRGN